jgi:CBS-domain-containing membrane protein
MLRSALGVGLGLGVIGLIGHLAGTPFLIAPFGASCVLTFGVPDSVMAGIATILVVALIYNNIGRGRRYPQAWF